MAKVIINTAGIGMEFSPEAIAVIIQHQYSKMFDLNSAPDKFNCGLRKNGTISLNYGDVPIPYDESWFPDAKNEIINLDLRSNPILLRAIEIFPIFSGTPNCNFEIVDVPPGNLYRIYVKDGREHVEIFDSKPGTKWQSS